MLDSTTSPQNTLSDHKAEFSELLTCPITLEALKDPVVAVDGFTYERSAIKEWNRCKKDSTRMPFFSLPTWSPQDEILFTNLAVRNVAKAWDHVADALEAEHQANRRVVDNLNLAKCKLAIMEKKKTDPITRLKGRSVLMDEKNRGGESVLAARIADVNKLLVVPIT
ncbi:hypothetical protein BC830DRAFT_1165146 [Chytriomyces sp. MP71]|nr:hypothetical protein BC830DRAFT_1165146 [Chytriomyces sp. MP71]